jgi:DNA-binding NtrC family response regulator
MADDTDRAAQRVWVVDDDRAVRFVLCTALRDAGYRVEGFDGAASALAMLDTQPPPDLLFTDVRMPGDDGLVLLDKLKAAHPHLPVIVMSAYTDVASTAGAFRGGAQEFLSKPFDLDDAVALAQRVLPEPDALASAPLPTAAEPGADQRPQLVGDTPAMRALFRAIGRLAQAPLSVLINGETGTGKELVAHGRFRADLLHRLDVVRLRLPPLRERRDDIAQLADTFLAAAARKLDTSPKRLTAAALQAMREHDWPGNVRELENVCWRMAALAASDTIGVADVDSALHRGGGARSTRAGGDPGQWETLLSTWARQRLAEGAEGLHAQVRERVDQALLEAALQITHGRRAEAAARLGMGRNTLTRKLGAGRRRGG